MKFIEKLEAMNACSEATEWVAHRGIVKAWRECPRGDWMLWLAGRLDIDRSCWLWLLVIVLNST